MVPKVVDSAFTKNIYTPCMSCLQKENFLSYLLTDTSLQWTCLLSPMSTRSGHVGVIRGSDTCHPCSTPLAALYFTPNILSVLSWTEKWNIFEMKGASYFAPYSDTCMNHYIVTRLLLLRAGLMLILTLTICAQNVVTSSVRCRDDNLEDTFSFLKIIIFL